MEGLSCENNARSLINDLISITKEKVEKAEKYPNLGDIDGVTLAWALKAYLDFFCVYITKGVRNEAT